MRKVSCAICKKSEKIIVLYQQNFTEKNISAKTFSARRLPDQQHYRIVKCIRCGLIFSNPILEKNKISNLYTKSDFTFDLESRYLKKTYGVYIKKMLSTADKEKVKLLEIGCSNGFFLEEILKMGMKYVYGIEPGKNSVAKASSSIKKKITVDILREGLFKKNSFDIICCFHTLDHVDNPNAFIKIVNGLLKKGGKVFFIVHDTNGITVKIFGEKSPIFDIEHVYLFNKQTLQKIFSLHHFTSLHTFPITNTYPLLYLTKLIPLQKKIKQILLIFLKITKIGFISIPVRLGNIGLTAEKF